MTKLKRLASICGAAKSLNMNYSTLYRLLTLHEKSLRVVTEENRKDVIDFYMKPQITQELPYKRFHDKILCEHLWQSHMNSMLEKQKE